MQGRSLDAYRSDVLLRSAVERPFELHLPSAVASSRADVILDEEGGVPTSLAIVDYKTATEPTQTYDLQRQVHTDAGQLRAVPVDKQGSHQLTSMVGANALIVLPGGTHDLQPGAAVSVLIIGPLS